MDLITSLKCWPELSKKYPLTFADLVWCFVQLYIFMESASKMCSRAVGFFKLLAALSRGANRVLTPARTCRDMRKLFVPAVAGREMLGVHISTDLDTAIVTWFYG